MEFLLQDALANLQENQTQTPATEIGQANIKVIGCGGGGGNVANWLYKKGVQGAEIIVMNTDKQHLDMIEADKKMLIGRDLTRGLGCGGFPQKGAEAAKEQMSEIKKSLKNSDMVFITAGMGGGTGTGSAPVVAQVAKEEGAIVIGSVTMPFSIERARIDKAEYGLQQLRNVCDTVIVIDNNRLVEIAGNLPVQQAFAVANELVSTMIKGIVEIIAVPSLVNLDYADVKAIMSNGDVSVVGIGESNTERRVDEAVRRALDNPLLEVSYEGATGALIHVAGGPDLTLDEVNQVGEMITEALDSDANVIWGARINNDMKGKLRIMAIITGVQSPYILGKASHRETQQKKHTMSNTLGVDFCR
ncbi:cell division protein FtsZ [archaeon]|jgi:cell division protein FtsZ|nr:cell division protein FtsZ [archaeon]MBT3730716.1 cell division protein FtsZ [archaeon]MBT4669618.1 cell division protein FtsZ [archaeon]MBT5030375.1 cell division protein FtsZ [archaeon]MBT5288332.1 cell division protein FtsZ [archaeon]